MEALRSQLLTDGAFNDGVVTSMAIDTPMSTIRIIVGTSAGIVSLFEVSRKVSRIWRTRISPAGIPIKCLFKDTDIIVVSQTEGEMYVPSVSISM